MLQKKVAILLVVQEVCFKTCMLAVLINILRIIRHVLHKIRLVNAFQTSCNQNMNVM